MNRILDFNTNKVEVLTLEELRSTVNEHNTGNRPFNGILHTQLWDGMCEIFEKNHVRYNVGDIYSSDSKNRIMPGVSILPAYEDKFGKGALETHLLRRVFGKISFPDFEDPDHGSAIALNFHQSGIELAYGNHVRVCQNLNIYGENFIRTYGENKVDVMKTFDIVENWVHKLSDFRENDYRVIEQMQDTRIVNVHGVIGKLLELAVTNAYIDSTLDVPLNIGQCSTFTKNMLKDHKDVLNGSLSVYEMQNLATDIIKPYNMNSQELLCQGNAIGRFFTEMLPEQFVESLAY